MIQRAVISVSRFSFICLYFEPQLTSNHQPPSFRHRSITPSCFPAKSPATLASKTRSHPPAHIQDPLTSTRSHPTALTSKTRSHPIEPPHRYCFTTTTTSTSKTRSHPAMLPSNDPLTSNNATLIHHTTPCCSPFHHQTAVSNHRKDAIHQPRQKQGTTLVYGFPARYSRLFPSRG